MFLNAGTAELANCKASESSKTAAENQKLHLSVSKQSGRENRSHKLISKI